MGRPLVTTNPDHTSSSNYYGLGSHGAVISSVDPKSHRTDRESDVWGRLGWVYEYRGNAGSEGAYALDATTAYAYSPLDQLNRVQDGAGNATAIAYDAAGRKTAMSDPDMGGWSYSYDPNGNLVQQTDAKHQTISFDYDALNRLSFKTAAEPTKVLFSDTFDSANSASWTYTTTRQTVPYNDNGNNVVKNVGTGTDYSAGYSRTDLNSMTAGKGLQFRFKSSGVNDPTYAHFILESGTRGTADYQGFGMIGNNSQLYIQYILGTTTFNPATLLNNWQPNTWYVIQMGINPGNGGMWLQVYQQDNPSNRGSYSTTALPAGRNWHFTQVSYGNTTYLDDYSEYSLGNSSSYPALYRYDEAGVANGKGQRTSMSNPYETVQWQYTARGQLSQATYSGVSGLSGGDTRSFSYTYDQADRLKTLNLPSLSDPSSLTAPSRESLTYNYDGASRPTGGCSSVTASCDVSNAQYTALGQMLSRTEGYGIAKSWTYSGAMQRLSEAKYTSAGGATGNKD